MGDAEAEAFKPPVGSAYLVADTPSGAMLMSTENGSGNGWYAWNDDSEHVPAQAWPKVAGPYRLLEQWRSTRVVQPLIHGVKWRRRMQWRPRLRRDAARL